ncbi:hypothetical protein L6164_016024 [Bauhinia variegata]|uniref:Uncharacterized protein n=1 Tax=Bauhinia variegata TaxID=167791 RepID=A0ACB9NRC9_BAUVA|nr:hypothetical protein L6164_016024 [Bauhinia variegata]
MNGYTKIGNIHKSRSTDFSDVPPFPETPKSSRKHVPSPTTKPEEPVQLKKSNTEKNSSPERVDEDEKGERFGVILGRSGSVSSASSRFQATMKRAFSMRRSSSVSDRYSRIHDQYMALAPAIGNDEVGGDETESRRSMKKKHRGGKIFRAWKRLIGL